MKMLGLLIWLVAGAVQAADTDMTFLATGTVIQSPYGNPGWGTPGDILQFQYTINPLINPEQDPSQLGPITSIAYSVNGGAFHPDNGWGYMSLGQDGYGFTLYPGNGAEISLNMNTGIMLEYDNEGFGNYARVNSVQQIGGTQALTAQAPEIDPAGWVSGLTLLIGGLLVLRGQRVRHTLAI